MEIYISEDDRVVNIQNAFSEAYPCLALEFYLQPHEAGQASRSIEKLSPEIAIDEIRLKHTFGWVNIDGHRTAAELEHDFRQLLGLNVQVLRRVGNIWLETTDTDSWTLQQLNDAGKQALRQKFHFPEERVEEN